MGPQRGRVGPVTGLSESVTRLDDTVDFRWTPRVDLLWTRYGRLAAASRRGKD